MNFLTQTNIEVFRSLVFAFLALRHTSDLRFFYQSFFYLQGSLHFLQKVSATISAPQQSDSSSSKSLLVGWSTSSGSLISSLQSGHILSITSIHSLPISSNFDIKIGRASC